MYPGTTFLDHLLRYERDPDAKLLVLLGEVGGVEEYRVCEALLQKRITKPLVAWCIGTCAKVFPYQVQFGHAGACAHSKAQTADAKNLALRKAGAIVPQSFDGFGNAIKTVYMRLVKEGTIEPKPQQPPPRVPVDYAWARKLGLVRKSANFISTVSDERGDELVYGGMRISEVFEQNLGVGGVVGLLWFHRRLPDYFCRFIEMVLMVTADHGPAVAGAHNTIVTARAGKDVLSALVSGLLTIGPRFGGALDGAAEQFSWGYDSGLSPEDFVEAMRKKKELIMGIGHRVKSLDNPDSRVVILKKYVKEHFKSTEVFDYACEVEKVTTKKRSTLILNVDGCIAVAFVDLLRGCGAFTREEADEYVRLGFLNGLFILGRSIGLIAHAIDQKRLKQPLYRHPVDDITYIDDPHV
jgi:ATP citrate (pro-S)-lyase